MQFIKKSFSYFIKFTGLFLLFVLTCTIDIDFYCIMKIDAWNPQTPFCPQTPIVSLLAPCWQLNQFCGNSKSHIIRVVHRKSSSKAFHLIEFLATNVISTSTSKLRVLLTLPGCCGQCVDSFAFAFHLVTTTARNWKVNLFSVTFHRRKL